MPGDLEFHLIPQCDGFLFVFVSYLLYFICLQFVLLLFFIEFDGRDKNFKSNEESEAFPLQFISARHRAVLTSLPKDR